MSGFVVVAALIDESGSMGDVRAETISGYNAFLKSIQAEQAGKVAYALGWTFDYNVRSDGKADPIMRSFCDGPLSDAVGLTEETYSPRAWTPLYDAIGGAINRIDALVGEKPPASTRVTFVIQTDGYENRSTEFTHAQVKRLIEDRQKRGWQIIFLGADLKDARSIGTGLGVMAANSMRYDKASTGATFGAMAFASSAYRGHDGVVTTDSLAVNLSDAQKAAFGDVADPMPVDPVKSKGIDLKNKPAAKP